MGTSAALPGPRGGAWEAARIIGERWATGRDGPEAFGAACRHALTMTLRADQDAFGLRSTMLDTGRRMAGALHRLHRDGACALTELAELPPGERLDAFTRTVADHVVAQVTNPATSAARRAAVYCAEHLLDRPASRHAVRDAGSTTRAAAFLPADACCQLYRRFFGQLVAEFVSTMLVTRVLLGAPLPQMLPFEAGEAFTGQLADRITEQIPDPCNGAGTGAAAVGAAADATAVADAAADAAGRVLAHAVHRALDLDPTRTALEAP